MSETYLHVLGYVGEVSIRDRDGNKMTGVIRVGTVNPDGSVQAFTSVSDGRFKDRQNFVLQDEAAALPYGTFGFWHIVVEPNRKDPNKDYIKSVSYDSANRPVAVVHCPEETVDEQRAFLHSNRFSEIALGVVGQMGCSLLLLTRGTRDSGPSAVLVRAEHLRGGVLSPDVKTLPVYAVREAPLPMRLGPMSRDVIGFWPRTTFDLPIRRLSLITLETAVVQQLQKETGSWARFQALCPEGTRKQHEVYQAFLQALESRSLREGALSEYGESDERLELALGRVKTAGKRIFTNEDELSRIAAPLIMNDPQKREEAEKRIEAQWLTENRTRIEALKGEVESRAAESVRLVETIEKQRALIDERKAELTRLEQRQTALTAGFEEQKAAFTAELEAKFEAARRDAAELIKDAPFWAFLAGGAPAPAPVRSSAALEPVAKTWAPAAARIPASPVEEAEDLAEAVEDNLCAAGFEEDSSEALGGVLLAAGLRRMPVVLAGPGAYGAAAALSLALFGTEPRVLDAGEDDCLHVPDDAVNFVTNVIEGNRFERLLMRASTARRLFVFEIPFVEELSLLPPGIEHYALPVCTELFLERIVDRPEERCSAHQPDPELLSKLSAVDASAAKPAAGVVKTCAVSRAAQVRLLELFGTAEAVLDEPIGKKNAAMLLLLPHALLTGSFDAVNEFIEADEGEAPASLKRAVRLYGGAR